MDGGDLGEDALTGGGGGRVVLGGEGRRLLGGHGLRERGRRGRRGGQQVGPPAHRSG